MAGRGGKKTPTDSYSENSSKPRPKVENPGQFGKTKKGKHCSRRNDVREKRKLEKSAESKAGNMWEDAWSASAFGGRGILNLSK